RRHDWPAGVPDDRFYALSLNHHNQPPFITHPRPQDLCNLTAYARLEEERKRQIPYPSADDLMSHRPLGLGSRAGPRRPLELNGPSMKPKKRIMTTSTTNS